MNIPPETTHRLLDTESTADLSITDPRYQRAHSWLLDEADLLDRGRYTEWFGRVGAEISYSAPLRNTTAGSLADGVRGETFLFRDDHYSLGKRIERLATEHAWSEDPPSRIRHLVTNVRVFESNGHEGELIVRSYVLVRRSRGDREAEVVSAARRDVLRPDGAGLVLARREILIDDAVLRTQTLAFFL